MCRKPRKSRKSQQMSGHNKQSQNYHTSDWWWSLDKTTLLMVLVLIVFGFVLSFSASPAIAIKKNYNEFYYVFRHLIILVPACLLMMATSTLSPKNIYRIALVIFFGGLILMVATLAIGVEAKGARRWLYVFGLSLQPSEFVKPAFVLLSAWLFAHSNRDPHASGYSLSVLFYGVFLLLLILQPDFGQALLVSLVWVGMFFLAGIPWSFIIALMGLGVGGICLAYFTMPHVTSRIDRFFNPELGDNYQIGRALDAIREGGLFGKGPGEGTIKSILPDAHTDFVFAVAAEEFGVIGCLLIIAAFAFIVLFILTRALQEQDRFIRFAGAGLAALFGLQALINIAVNLDMIPAKGMTLPFISYGGSSLLATGFTVGCFLSLTRKRPRGEIPLFTEAPDMNIRTPGYARGGSQL